ncbi:MAG: hypothetical protein Q9170_006317 [Blastenia crenularia]
MIERATTCLENGGRHLLRAPKTPFRTHRYLHSTFWSHGAGDINLPAWWHAFLQVPSTSQSQWLTKGNRPTTPSVACDNIPFAFLDFLYPVQTLAFIRQCVNEKTTALSRHRRSQLSTQRSRTYTSAADNPDDTSVTHRDTAQNLGIDHVSKGDSTDVGSTGSTEDKLNAGLHELLWSKESDTRDIWALYGRMKELSVPVDRGNLSRLFRRLRQSGRTLDFEKIRELFDTVASSDRAPTHYKCAISAALKQNDLSSAMAMQEEAMQRRLGSYGLFILKYAVEHSQWNAATGVWQRCKDYSGPGAEGLLIWKDVITLPLPKLLGKAIEAVELASASDDAKSTRNFAAALARTILSIQHKEFDQSLQNKLVGKIQSTEELSLDLVKAAILQSLSVGVQSETHIEAAIDLYKDARRRPNFAPDLELLDALLVGSHAARDSQAIYNVLDDYRNHHTEPPRQAYLLLISQLARHGDFDSVDQLVQESINRFGANDITRLVPHLLYACFRRAEVDRAVSVIESLQQKYAYSPDLRTWNILLATYARVRDSDGAMALQGRIMESGLRPDNSTYATLMGLFAQRSDYETTTALYKQAVSEGIKPDAEMVSSLVMALATNDHLDEAERTAEEAVRMDLESSQRQTRSSPGNHALTRIWNTLLAQNAMKGQLEKVFELQKRMQELAVPFDGLTYAALMQSLCIKLLPAAAQKILKTVMPQRGVRPTALHYAIVMAGFVTIKDYNPISSLFSRMVEQGIRPTFSTQNALLRFASNVDEKEYKNSPSDDKPFTAIRAEKLLDSILNNLDPIELATLGPTKYAVTNPPNVAFQSSYFPYLIAAYGRNRSFDKVKEMYNKFITVTKRSDQDADTSLPVDMLTALMGAHSTAGEHDEVEKCWYLAMEKSREITCKAGADSSEPGWVLHRYRYTLSRPLSQYMQALQATSRADELSAIIVGLQDDGYELSVYNWNTYVKILIQDKDPVLAYQICEKQLITGWPGWDRFGKSEWDISRKIMKQFPRHWELGRPYPRYDTLVYLASAYLDAQAMAYGMGRDVLQEIERVAPRTLEVVHKMPRLHDDIQNQLLRRE